MNYLIRNIGVICQSPSQKCLCHYYLHELMQVFVYENLTVKLQISKSRFGFNELFRKIREILFLIILIIV